MPDTSYRGYVIVNDKGQWCVNLGIEKGWKCFATLEQAKSAIDERIREIEQETKGRP